eukprot:CAMPEP_0170213476 /NCGR_PEP_ID=MMETSP0116_2-20130129/6362_1 /TAXON_ID=400756 /ORGANISM="Durinskia baltica, Strain CSIRO CS-38" /LENGTH=532 /DNA_ID=CAMNT_0010464027 /DNA_START=83 /DNA_END=1682 /DNA_ORIENTATION=+
MGRAGAFAEHSQQSQQQQQQEVGEATKEREPIVALFNIPLVGHMNPTFPLVMELVRRGCRVHYFLPPNEDFRSAARTAGANVESYLEGDPVDFDMEACGAQDGGDGSDTALRELMVWPLASTLLVGDYIIARCRDLRVQVVLYNPGTPHGLIVAERLGLPWVSLVTFLGLGSVADLFPDPQILEVAKAIRRPYGQVIKETFGVDLHDQRISRFMHLARLNLVTTSEDLMAPMPPAGHAEWADEAQELCESRRVGCMVSDEALHITAAAATGPTLKAAPVAARSDFGRSLPLEELAAAAARGAKVIYAALGTMALSTRWSQDLGFQSGGNLPPGTTGKDFCQHVWRALIEATRRLGSGYLCVLCVGTQPDALDFLGDGQAEDGPAPDVRVRHVGAMAAVPKNVVLRSSLSQVQMLQSHADAFVSHVGFNSMQQSLYAGVPLIAVPQAVDQPANARRVEASEWGRAFLKPMESVSAESLDAAIREVTAAGSRFQDVTSAAMSRLQGGPARAAEILVAISEAGRRVEQVARQGGA